MLAKSKLTNLYTDNVFPYDNLGVGRMIFSGPDGLSDYRSHRLVDTSPIGTDLCSTERTLDSNYLWRAPPTTPFHRPRSTYVGEIGWGVWFIPDRLSPGTGHQMLTSEFRRAIEDKFTHRFQTPWYEGRDINYTPLNRTTQNNSNDSRDMHTSSGSREGFQPRKRLTSRFWQRSPEATQTTLHDFGSCGVEIIINGSDTSKDFTEYTSQKKCNNSSSSKQDAQYTLLSSGDGELDQRPYTSTSMQSYRSYYH